MVPKLHKKAYSFRGVARYVLGDREGPSSDRVAWTEPINLSTRNPDMAWRVMAATAMDQARLKREAGIPNTGRKSNLCVQHFTLSWHPEEADGLTKAEMIRAAQAMLRVMKADKHQALLVAHDDQAHPHVHVLLNRVNPDDGRLLSSSFEKLKASRWAQKYEEERGKIYCEERVLNNEARDRGEYTRGDKDDPRHLHEALEAANDNDARERLLAEHRRKSRELKAAARQLEADRDAALAQLEAGHLDRKRELTRRCRQSIARARTRIRDRSRPLWQRLRHEHAAERRAHELREERVLGRVQNALAAIDFGALVGGREARQGRAKTIGEVFQLLSDSGARAEAMKRKHEQESQALHRRQKRVEKQAADRRRRRRDELLAEAGRQYLAERNARLLLNGMERAKLRAQWLEKGRKLRDEIERLPRSLPPDRRTDPYPDVENPTKPSDLLPARNAAAVARRIDKWRELRSGRSGRGRDPGRGRDDDWER
ncbi:Relaxase/Mobilization nuclease domain protein [Posidoniimonas polymericola]|uniref:Relaxase/Mobilization nuclease domain protein n=1 Tax=Posidoniimonas polymericola TaxID=2528002 RepID=A0A5C5XUP6_9BACT|nr:relaxase/mobilization nuclease domain-containing protein [Posidoniimonas polymericola]TWT67036.1 Relaxase/Mobilization nuclease domain protein [Posidoniimonas polymericola]